MAKQGGVKEPDALDNPVVSLKFKVAQGLLAVLDPSDFKYNLQHHSVKGLFGGEAEVQIVDWRLPPASASGGDSRTCPIHEGRRVALKVHHAPNGRGSFLQLADECDVEEEALNGMVNLRNEVNALMLLGDAGFAERVPRVLGIVQHRGDMKDLPLYGYAMPAYRYGSLASLIRDTCDRRVPESVFADFFTLRQGTSEYHTLMHILARIHTERGYMLQDISSNNLLVKELARGGCHLLLSDPSMTKRICDLANPNKKDNIVSTWLWGSLATRYKQFDRTADNFGLSVCFLELWLCMEGAPCGLTDLMLMTGGDANRDKAHAFVRALCAAVLHRQAVCPGAIVPRIKRELPVSWLMLWLLLLGTEDFAAEEQLLNGHQHRRPAEADMVDAAAQLAAVAADVEALGGSLTAESLATPAGEALVARCLHLYERLASLSQLEPPQGSLLVPLDASLSWVATYFMAQDHPLVAAMRAAQGAAAAEPPAFQPVPSNKETFFRIVEDLQQQCGGSPYHCFRDRDRAVHYFQGLLQEHARCVQLARELLPPEQHGVLLQGALLPEDLWRYALSVVPEAAAGATTAAAPADPHWLLAAGPPPAHPLAAGPASMPQWPPAPPPPRLAAVHAASMPAPPSCFEWPALAAALPASTAALYSGGLQPPHGAAAAPANMHGLVAAGLPAQLAAAAALAAPADLLAPGGIRLPNTAAASGAASQPPTANRLLVPGMPAHAPGAYVPAPSSGHMPGLSAAAAAGVGLQYAPSPAGGPPFGSLHGPSSAAAAPRSPAAFPAFSWPQQLLTLPSAAGDAASPSADLSSRTVAGGPGDASPATSGGSGLSSPSKRKRGAEQPDQVVPGTILRFAVSRHGVVAGLPAFRLPAGINGSNIYAHMVAQLCELFRGDVHQLLAQKQGPYTALLAASSLQPAQLDSLVADCGSGDAYIEVSAASFLPLANAADYTAAAPIIFHSSSRGTGGGEQQIECGGGSAEEQADYSAVLQNHLKQSRADGQALACGSGTTATVLFRIARARLPPGAATMPWVPHEWAVSAADLTAILSRAKHLFRKR